jgi:hypothetical protein
VPLFEIGYPEGPGSQPGPGRGTLFNLEEVEKNGLILSHLVIENIIRVLLLTVL